MATMNTAMAGQMAGTANPLLRKLLRKILQGRGFKGSAKTEPATMEALSKLAYGNIDVPKTTINQLFEPDVLNWMGISGYPISKTYKAIPKPVFNAHDDMIKRLDQSLSEVVQGVGHKLGKFDSPGPEWDAGSQGYFLRRKSGPTFSLGYDTKKSISKVTDELGYDQGRFREMEYFQESMKDAGERYISFRKSLLSEENGYKKLKMWEFSTIQDLKKTSGRGPDPKMIGTEKRVPGWSAAGTKYAEELGAMNTLADDLLNLNYKLKRPALDSKSIEEGGKITYWGDTKDTKHLKDALFENLEFTQTYINTKHRWPHIGGTTEITGYKVNREGSKDMFENLFRPEDIQGQKDYLNHLTEDLNLMKNKYVEYRQKIFKTRKGYGNRSKDDPKDWSFGEHPAERERISKDVQWRLDTKLKKEDISLQGQLNKIQIYEELIDVFKGIHK
jgi:hypothetical protein